ncbi:MAG: hypothetical protein AAF383_22640 [Cyanobacteria bacterium P01_A01_bin.83]
MTTTATVKQPISNLEVTKPVIKGIELDLNKILAEAWNKGLPNDFQPGF